jgi:hypothetical protein
MVRRVLPLLLLATAAIALAEGDPAGGAGRSAPLMISTHGNEVTVLGRGQSDEVRVLREESDLKVQSIDDSGTRHTWLDAPYGQYTKLNASLGDARDGFLAETPLPAMDLAVSGGRGNDVIVSAHVQRVYGGPGDDSILGSGGGGPGSDLFNDGGADVMRGGPGPDVLHGGRGADLLDGGPGPGRDRCSGGTPAGRHIPAAKRDRAVHCEKVSGVP